MPRRLLFLCTGNYYRSRFAEILFNALAAQSKLDWVADSRGLAAEFSPRNVGPLSPYALEGLKARGIRLDPDTRHPLHLTEADLAIAERIIALKEAEHRPLLAARFPGWEERSEYWHVHDLNDSAAQEALAEIERRVRGLIGNLLASKDLGADGVANAPDGPPASATPVFKLSGSVVAKAEPSGHHSTLREGGESMQRCDWAGDGLMRDYHDAEWGVPLHDDRRLFEFLVLEGAQAGLSWTTILNKRENYRAAFDGFDPEVVARYNEQKVKALLADPGIVRNRMKVDAAIRNAKAFIDVRREFGTFDAYVWGFVGGRPKVNAWRELREIPALTPESVAMSKDLKRRGFTFVGPTICYAFMQAVGMVNDHVVDCFRHVELSR